MATRRRTPNPEAAPRRALLLPAHPYKGRTGSCKCADGDHVPCAVPGCGASEHAYVHTDAAADAGYEQVVVEGSDAFATADTGQLG
jgi:hypothetical protein